MKATQSDYSVSRFLISLTFVFVFVMSCAVETMGQKQRGRVNVEAPENAPNIVIFLIDTLRADHLGAYGYKRRETSPRIDELAAEAVVFENAYAPAPWTLPSVASIMTSTMPCEHGTVDDRYPLEKHMRPLAMRLQVMDYATLGLYANSYVCEDYEMDRGFDVLQPSAASGGEATAKLLDAYSSEPFYLYIHNIEPHTPHSYAPESTEGFRDIPVQTRKAIKKHYDGYRALTRADFSAGQPLGVTDNTMQQRLRLAGLTEMKKDYVELYDAAVRRADVLVGEVIDELKRRGAWDNTLFILMADHGEEMNEHGGWLHDQSVYEELIHVPLIMRFPHSQFGGSRVDRVVSLIDVMPTIFDFLTKPKFTNGCRGENLMPLVRGDSDLPEEDFRIISMRMNSKKYFKPWKEQRGDVNIVVRKGKWKGIWNVEQDNVELYDLEADPLEKRDLSKKNPQLALVMKLFASEYYDGCVDHARRPEKRDIQKNDKLLRNLRMLGYAD